MRRQNNTMTMSRVIALLIVFLILAFIAWQEGGQVQPTPTTTPGRPTVAALAETPRPTSGTIIPVQPGGLPDMPQKPQPVETTFQGCPPGGDGGDMELNKLKNRVDEGAYVPVTFDSIVKLAWPPATERRNMQNWSAADRAFVEKYNGIPVSVEGYLADIKKQGPESTNCHGADDDMRDWHIWLTQNQHQDRSGSIVVEATPRIRPKHPGWQLDTLRQIVNQQQRVRISGWLMLDPEHPDQVDKTRGTIWEIHPIMKIEVEQNGRWVSLDSYSAQ